MPLVSIVLPVYNGETTIAGTLRSIFAQTFSSFELLVIDDGSDDRTVDVVAGFQGDRRLRLIHQANAGQANARNRGIAEARGEWVAFIDADDWWLPQKLELQLAALEAEPEAAWAYCWTELVDDRGRPTGDRVTSPFFGQIAQPLLVTDFIASGSNPLVRRSALAEVGGFDPALVPSEDWDLWLRLADRYPVALVPELLVLYRQRPTSSSDNVWRQATVSQKIIQTYLQRLTAADRDRYAPFVWGNRYKYLAYKALDAPPSFRRSRSALGYLARIIACDRGILKQWPAIGWLVLRLGLGFSPGSIGRFALARWPILGRSPRFLLGRTLVPRFTSQKIKTI